MSEVGYLDAADLIQLTDDLAAGPVRDVGLLDPAAARRWSVLGEDADPSTALKPAALSHSGCRNHAG